MNSTIAIQKAENAIRSIAEQTLPHASLVLFGSRARGDAGRRSDFDLAVFPSEGFETRELLEFSDQLDRSPQIIYPLDIVDTRSASSDLINKIQKEGRSWKS